MTGTGTSYGAISVINAIPCGIGATIGITLKTVAKYSEEGDERIVNIANVKNIKSNLARICVKKTLETIGADRSVPYVLDIDSRIPPSRGLKSSSSVCNAVISAVLDEHGVNMSDMDIIKLGVKCAREAGVTITGAIDDACGCHLGGLVITDNSKDKLLFRKEVPKHDVVLCIPDNIITKNKVPVDKYLERKAEVEKLIEQAEDDPFGVLTANGRIVGEIIGADMDLVDLALENGAVAVGITGTGPAIAVVVEKGKGKSMSRKLGCKTILSETR